MKKGNTRLHNTASRWYGIGDALHNDNWLQHTACTNRTNRTNRTRRPKMPRGVKEGSKRDRQYEHIRDSYEDRGVSRDEAEERAARTVNKERREAGETKEQRGK
jgi:hypothetical protein